jgi:GxxExxY protein
MKYINHLTEEIIGCAIEVHKNLGPGMLESAYEQCLCYELKQAGLNFERQKEVPIKYKEITLDCGYRIDILVENQVVIELKAVEKLNEIHSAQTLTHMNFADIDTGLLINFNEKLLKNGIKRFRF